MKRLHFIFVLFLLLISSAYADQKVTSPIHLRMTGDQMFKLERTAPSHENLWGWWQCIGSASYNIEYFCPYDQLFFAQKDGANFLVLKNSIQRFEVSNVKFKTRLDESNHVRDSKFYNYIQGDLKVSGEDKKSVTLTGEDSFNNHNVILSDCTSFGTEILVCKTAGYFRKADTKIDDYKPKTEKYKEILRDRDNKPILKNGKEQEVEKTRIALEVWTVFMKAGSSIPKPIITSYEGVANYGKIQITPVEKKKILNFMDSLDKPKKKP